MKLVAAPARLSTAAATFEADFAARLHWSADTDAAIEQRVADILADVQKRGDAAVLEYTARFDGLHGRSMAALELTQAELKAAFDAIPAVQRDALQAAAARVRSYHEAQKKASARAGATATKTAPCWARRSRRWTAWASMCPAARPPTRAAC
jgi:histidinol dehydrogenase